MIIETHHVAKRFGRFEAIEDLSLSVPEGAVFALIGSNGTGKTTTIRMLMTSCGRIAARSRCWAGHRNS